MSNGATPLSTANVALRGDVAPSPYLLYAQKTCSHTGIR
jgi:hypothetical protein